MSESIEDFPVLPISEEDLAHLPEYQWTMPTGPDEGFRFKRANGPTSPEHYWPKGIARNRTCEWAVGIAGHEDESGRRIPFAWYRTGITTATVPSRSHSYLNPAASTQDTKKGNP